MARRKVQENHLADMAARAEMDHEVQMARSDLYKIAKYAVELHDMLKSVSEAEGMQGWQQAKITKAADYLGSVYHSMDYDTNVDVNESEDLDENRLKAVGGMIDDTVNAARHMFKRAKNIKLSDVQSELKKFIVASQGGVAELRRARAQSKLYRSATEASNAAANLQVAMNKQPKLFAKVFKKYGITEQEVAKIIEDVINPQHTKATSGMGRKTADMISADKIAIAKKLVRIKNTADEDADMALRFIILAIIAGFFVAGEKVAYRDEKVDEKKQIDRNGDGKNDWEDVKLARKAAAAAAEKKNAKVDEGKKKAKPDFLDVDKDGNKKEPMKKALQDKKKNANESMLRTVTQAIDYKAGKIGAANVTPKAMNLAETMVEKDLKRLQASFKKNANVDEAKDTHKTKDGRTAKKGLYYYVNKRKKAGTSRKASSPKAPKPKDWKNAAKTAKS